MVLGGFEKIPDSDSLSAKEKGMLTHVFKDLKLTLDSVNYSFNVMKKIEVGTWKHLNTDKYSLSSSKGTTYQIGLSKISENQLLFDLRGKKFQLQKLDSADLIIPDSISIDHIKGKAINQDSLIGNWTYISQIKNGKERPNIFNHSDSVKVNYQFKEDGEFINMAPLGIYLTGIWDLSRDKKTITIQSKDKIESLKVVQFSKNTLQLYNPRTNSILKFNR